MFPPSIDTCFSSSNDGPNLTLNSQTFYYVNPVPEIVTVVPPTIGPNHGLVPVYVNSS
jgi:hypothetical protein